MDFKILTIYFAIIIILLCVIYRMLVGGKTDSKPYNYMLEEKISLLGIKAINHEVKMIVSGIYFDPEKIDKEDAENMFINDIAIMSFRIRGSFEYRRNLAERYLRILQNDHGSEDKISQVYLNKLKMLNMKLHSTKYITLEQEDKYIKDIHNIEREMVEYINERYNKIIADKEI